MGVFTQSLGTAQSGNLKKPSLTILSAWESAFSSRVQLLEFRMWSNLPEPELKIVWDLYQ